MHFGSDFDIAPIYIVHFRRINSDMAKDIRTSQIESKPIIRNILKFGAIRNEQIGAGIIYLL